MPLPHSGKRFFFTTQRGRAQRLGAVPVQGINPRSHTAGAALRPRTAPRHTPTQDGGAAASPAWAPADRRPEGFLLPAQVGGRAAAARGERGGAGGLRGGAGGLRAARRAFGAAWVC